MVMTLYPDIQILRAGFSSAENAMLLAEGDAQSSSCLSRLRFCSLHGFSPEEELVLISCFCGGDPGMFSPLPTLGAILGLGLGP